VSRAREGAPARFHERVQPRPGRGSRGDEDTAAPLRVFTPGAIAGVLAWVGLSLLFGLYVSRFGNYDKTYGALGAIIVFLTWRWLSNMARLIGAAIDAVRQHEKVARREDERARGIRRPAPEPPPA
jgi:membrane protein